MIKLEGFDLKDELYNGASTIIYRAIDIRNSKNVVVKVLKSEYPTPDEIKKFSYEYEIAKKLDIEGVIKNYEMIEYKNTRAIIMEDCDGISMDKMAGGSVGKKIGVKNFLIFAVKIIDILGKVHANKIIHKDIKPHNILINTGTGDIRLIDFSISSQLSKEQQELKAPEDLEGTLSYISPEQTGRMNRSVDYRSDFYSLGVTFYELITGKLPFEGNDPMELVHSHIAKTPVRPDIVSNEIPVVISDIIMKMMSKQAEERYQSAYGLKKDLEKSYKLLKETGSIEPFEIGVNDISDRFQIPEKLYGRENEMNVLMSKFDSASNGKKEVMLFTGSPGIGKSAIINEMHKPVTAGGGFFIEGKFDQLKRNIPYSAIIEAFQSMIRQLITESDDKIAIWKEKILKATGNNVQVIIQMIPELEMITGEQPEIQPLPPAESQNRFNMVFQNFTRALADKSHPLVLFIDDCQWADSASLNLIYAILTDIELGYFMFIGSYRDSDVNTSHQLYSTIEKIKKEGVNIESIKIDSLQKDAINMLLSETLIASADKTAPLADIVMSKSGGNPFFINEFVRTLHDQGFIHFNEGWKWDLKGIQSAGITDNVVELMTKKIKKLPVETMKILKTASCIGNSFELPFLSQVTGQSEDSIFNMLKEAVNEGMIIKIDRIFKFIHDRVREAAYGLSDEKGKTDLHYRIAQELLKNYSADKSTEEELFTLVGHLNKAVAILNADEKKNLLLLNLDAGKRAKANAAFEAAAEYLRVGSLLLTADSWKSDYENTLDLYMQFSEAEYLSLHYENAEKLFAYIIENATGLLEKLKIYQIMIMYFETLMKFEDAVNLMIKVSNIAGIPFPEISAITQDMVMVEMNKFHKNLNGRSVGQLIELSFINDLTKAEVLSAMANCIVPIWMNANQAGLPFLILTMVNISIEYGLYPPSAVAFIFLGIILSSGFGQFDLATELGELGMAIQEKLNYKFLKPMMYFMNYVMLEYWKKPLRNALPKLIEAYQDGMETGNVQWGSYGIAHYAMRNIWVGNNLNDIKIIYDDYYSTIQKLKQLDTMEFYKIPREMVETLLGNNKESTLLVGEFFDETTAIGFYLENKYYAAVALYHVCKIITVSVMDNFDIANAIAKSGEQIVSAANFGQPQVTVFKMFSALSYLQISCNVIETIPDTILLAQFDTLLTLCSVIEQDVLKSIYTKDGEMYLVNTGESDEMKVAAGKILQKAGYFKNIYIEKAQIIIDQVKIWAENSEENFGVFDFLLSAELSRVNNDIENAMSYYDKAISIASKYKYLQYEAIANECAAKYYLSKGLKKIAGAYMVEARYCYEKWGAKAKVDQLNEKYSELLQGMGHATTDTGSLSSITASTSGRTTSRSGGTGSLDMGTVMKASQALAGEIEMSRLLDRMMRILTENAGAQKGALLLMSEKGEMTIEAESFDDRDTIDVLKSIALDTVKTLSQAIVRYVARTKEAVVLNDASTEGTFTKDDYVVNKKPKSVLCVPVINQGKLIGVLYMENNALTP